MNIDLHSHSTHSDGTLSPSELLALVGRLGIQTFALTDHDTISGLDEAKREAKQQGVSLIHGVEISCHHTLQNGYGKNQSINKTIHVVALNFDDLSKMSETLERLQDSRENRGYAIVQKLVHLLSNHQLAQQESLENHLWQAVLVKASGNPKAVGRAHIAQVLYEMGLVKSVQDAFDKYLADNKPAYVEIDSLSMEKTIDFIHECGGVAVLAHPTRYNLSATRVRKLIEDFAMFGGDAVELPIPSEPQSTRAMIDRCAEKHGLMVSVGSDFHGSTMPWRKLGLVAKPTSAQKGVWEIF